MKPLLPTAMILACDPIHISHLNSTLMLSDCAGERLTLDVGERVIGKFDRENREWRWSQFKYLQVAPRLGG